MAEKGPDVKYFCFDCKKNFDEAERKQHERHDIEEQSQALEKSKECLKIICSSTPDEYEQMINFFEDLKIENKKNCPQSLSSGPTIKIASWNLKTFHLKKVDLFKDKNIIEIVTNTIIKNGVTVIAFQEIGNKGDALYEVYEQLKQSTDDKWEIAVSEKSTGRMFQGMEYGAFIWNYSSGLKMTREPYPVSLTKKDGTKMFTRQPYVGEFVINKWNFSLVSFHLKSRNGGFANTVNDAEVKALHTVVDDIQRDPKNGVILLGDFNRSMEIHPDSELGKKKYTAIFEHSKYTNMARTDCYDNIIIPRSCKKRNCHDHEVFFPTIYKTHDGKVIFDHGLIVASFNSS